MKYLINGGFWLAYGSISFFELAKDYFILLFIFCMGMAFITMAMFDAYCWVRGIDK